MMYRFARSILRSFKVIIVLACMAATGQVAAADKLQYGPAGTWITSIPLPKPDAAQKDAPFQVLLAHFQVKFGADGDDLYTEFATLVQTPAGLSAMQPTIVWNPDTETVTIHKVQIRRGDQVIDLLAKGQTFTVVRRESNLERAMLDGVLTGVLQPEDIRVGDVLIYAMSTKRLDPIFRGNSEGFIGTATQSAIGRLYVRAVWGPEKAMRWRYSEDLTGKNIKGKGRNELVVDVTGAKSPAMVSEAPLRFNQFGQVEFSQFADWKQISDLLVGAYDSAATLPSDSSLRGEVAKIRAVSSDPKIQAALALRLTEDQVRYLYLGINQGGYIPAGAETTWQRRFGDCKGKTVLLLALLRELGIKAEPALVNSQIGDGLNERLPLVGLFDHVIVRVEIAGKVYWLDATRFGDRDLEALAVPDYRWALPLRKGGADLEALKVLPLDKPVEETLLKLDASAGLEVPARIHAEKIYRGDAGITGNAGLMSMTAADREKRLRELWTENYSWVEPRKVSMRFDELRGELQLIMDGVARMAWNESSDGKAWKYETDGMRVGWAYETKRESGQNSDAPVVIDFPYYGLWKEEIILPKGGKGFTLEGDQVDQTLGGATFKRTMSIKGNVVTLEASKRSLVSEITYAENNKATPVLMAMYKKGVYLLAPKNYKNAPKGQAAAVNDATGTAPKTVDELIAQGAQNYLDQKYDAALSNYSQALRLDPVNAKALFGRGMIFMLQKQNYAAAAADFEQVIKSDPTNWQAYNGIGSIKMWQGKTTEAIDAFSKALAIFPNDVYALEYRGKAYLDTGDKANARKDAEAASQLDPASPMIIDLLTQLALDDNKIEDAKAVVKKALETNPDDIGLHYKLAEVAESCRGLKTDKCLASKAEAVEAYDRVIAIKPSAYAYARRAQARPATERQKRMDDIAAGIKQEPTSNMPLMVRATIWLSEKNYDKAIEDLNAAIKLNPKDTEPYSLRVQVYLSAGKLDAAFAEIDTLVKDNPTRPYFFNLSCWERATRNREIDKALADCNSAISLSPESSAYLDSRGLVNIRLGRFDLAIADYDAALKFEPDMASSLYGRGIAKLRKGDKAAGNADLEAARKLYDKIDGSYLGYGIKP